MVLVGTHEPNTALEVAPRSTWGTIATGSAGEAWLRCPIISETLTLDTQPIEDPEIGDAGFAEAQELGSEVSRGVITLAPYYDVKAVFALLTNAFGGMEAFKADVNMNVGLATTGNTIFSGTHYWATQSQLATATGSASAIPPGLSARIWKSGPTTAGYVLKYTDLLPTGFTWEQTQGAGPRISFPVIASKQIIALASSEAALTTISSTASRVKWDHLRAKASANPGIIQYGASLESIPCLRFSITMDGSWEIPEALTSLGTLGQPRHNGRWGVTGEIEFLVEQNAPGDFFPLKDFIANNVTKLLIRYEGAPLDGSPLAGHGWEWRLPGIKFTSIEAGIRPGVLSQVCRFRCEKAFISNTDIASGADYNVQVMLQTHGLSAVDADTTYLTAEQGANQIPAGELRTGTP